MEEWVSTKKLPGTHSACSVEVNGAGRSSWTDLGGALQLPIADEVAHHLLFRTGSGLLLRGLSDQQAGQQE